MAEAVKRAVGFEGEIIFDNSKPDGTPRKLLDSTRIQATGWKPSIALNEGLKTTYQTFLEETLDDTVRS